MKPLHRLIGLVLWCWLVVAPSAHSAPPGYVHTLVGNPGDSLSSRPPTQPAVVLMGGGSDVDEAFRWMIAKSGGGDFVVLRASGEDGYNAYLFGMGGMDSVETLVVRTRNAAADPFVLDRVAKAEALFIAGGDQADYIRLWKDTPLQAAIQALVARKVPVGGTSAGLAVLGEIDFAALNGTVESGEALSDPYRRQVTLDRGFLVAPGLAGTVTDSHFRSRDRMGRLLSFVARSVQDEWVGVTDARGIGVDEQTALVVDGGIGTRLGIGAVYFLRPTVAPAVCRKRKALTFRNVQVDRLDGAGNFDLGLWSGSGTTRYDLSAETGRLVSSQPLGQIY